jgi:hypothetical protein
MTDSRGPDPLRLAEAAIEAALVLATFALPTAWRLLDGELLAIFGAMLVGLTAVVYALHAVTLDCLRLTGHRPAGRFGFTHRED